jgi:hypothetical protein
MSWVMHFFIQDFAHQNVIHVSARLARYAAAMLVAAGLEKHGLQQRKIQQKVGKR